MTAVSSKLSKTLAMLGCAILALGAGVHLLLGFPPLVRGVEAGIIGSAPGMSTSELKAVWVAGACLMLVMSVAPLLALSSRVAFRRVAAVCGLGGIACAIVVFWFVAAVHPAIAIFGLSGLFFAAAAWSA